LVNRGELQVIFDIYHCYLQRISQYREFVEAEIKQGVEFESDEYYQTDRKELNYCKDDAELKKLWKQRLKNDLLYYRLMQKIMTEQASDPKVQADLQKRWFKKSPEDKVRSRLHDVYNAASQNDRMDILGIFLTAASQVYGPHSYYSTPKQAEDFDIHFSLSLTGIGATLTNEDGYVKVVHIVPKGPADKDGRLKVEDRIIAVTQEGGEPLDIIDMSVSNAVKYIRGPANTKVTLTVLPAAQGASAMPVDITIVRGKVELQEEAAQGRIQEVVLENGVKKRIGIITLNSFYMDFDAAARGEENYRSCTRDVQAILENFKAGKVDSVVLDLRNNSGGSLKEAISLSGLFITRGPIVQVVDSGNHRSVYRDPDPAIVYSGPLVLLVSKFSASSTEILSGAMQDYRRAVLVGDSRTYGKGTVLSVTDLNDMLSFFLSFMDMNAGSLTYECAMFYRVSGGSNQAKGVNSDIVLPSFSEEMEIGEMFNDNFLPWGQISAVSMTRESYSGYKPLTDIMIGKLAENSRRRYQQSPKLRQMQSEIQRFREVRKRKKVSLNEKKRLQEYYDEKAASDRVEAMMDISEKNGKDKEARDLLLQEAAAIAAEYAYYQQQGVEK